jgi:hypothetical protein
MTYPLTTPFKASGTTFGFCATLPITGSSVYTPIGELKNFDTGGTDIAVIDTTLLVSTAKTKIPSIPDNGDVTFSVFLVPGLATVVQLQAWSQSPATVAWQIQLPDGTPPVGSAAPTGTTITFMAFLSNYAAKGFEVDGSPMADVTLTISGGVTMTPGT